MTGWFYEESKGVRSAEVAEEEIIRLIRSNILLPNSLVWQKGMAGWTALEDTPLAQYIHEPEPEPVAVEIVAPPSLPQSSAAPPIIPPEKPTAQELWHFEREDGTPNEPVSKAEISALLEKGQIRHDSLVWKKGMPDWSSLKDSELAYLCQSELAAPKPNRAINDSTRPQREAAFKQNSDKILSRFGARITDTAIALFITGSIMFFIVAYLESAHHIILTRYPELLTAFVILFSPFFISGFYAMFNNTLGKRMAGLVLSQADRPLQFSEMLKREYNIFFRSCLIFPLPYDFWRGLKGQKAAYDSKSSRDVFTDGKPHHLGKIIVFFMTVATIKTIVSILL